MITAEFLAYVRSRDIRLWVEGGQLRYSAPNGVLTPTLRQELATRKQEILAFLSMAIPGRRPAPPLLPAAREGPLPTSFPQQRLWFLAQLEPDNPRFNVATAVRMRGNLTIAALQRSLNALILRHEVLRTSFANIDGRPVQLIQPAPTIALPLTDLAMLAVDAREQAAQHLLDAAGNQPFDLTDAPLLRAALLRLAPDDHILLLTIHHIVADLWSMSILIQELAAMYAAFSHGHSSPLPDLPIQYADYTVWQRQWLHGTVLDDLLGYWKQQLAGAPALIALPTDRPRPAVQSYRGAAHTFVLAPPLAEAIKALCRREGATLFMTLLTAFNALLYRYSRQADMVVGTRIAGRDQVQTERLIGFFVNVLPLRTLAAGTHTLRQLLQHVRETALGAFAHQDLPFDKLVEELQPERDLSRQPLFNVMFVLQNTPTSTLAAPGLTLQTLDAAITTAKYDLDLAMGEEGAGIRGIFEYSTDLFDAPTIARMASEFQHLLEQFVANPDQQLDDLLAPGMAGASVQQSALPAHTDPGLCLAERFAIQVVRQPHALAIFDQHQALTYQELDHQSTELAAALQAHGIAAGSCVAVYTAQPLARVSAVLACLKLGATYLPLDSAMPLDLLPTLLRTTQTACLADAEQLAQLQAECPDTLFLPLDATQYEHQQAVSSPTQVARAHSAALWLPLSGTYAAPQPVPVTEDQLRAELGRRAQHTPLTAEQVLALVVPVTSWGWLPTLYEGLMQGCATFLPGGGLQNTAALASALPMRTITQLHISPAVLGQLLADPSVSATALPALERIHSVGDHLPNATARRCAQRLPDVCLVHKYGTPQTGTVTHTYVSDETLSAWGYVVLGWPLPHTHVALLDATQRPVLHGAAGAVHIGNTVVPVNKMQPATHEPHISSSHQQSHQQLFATGDIARYRTDGALEYLGRFDQLHHVEGCPIHPGAIEAVLDQHPTVMLSAVQLQTDPAVPGKQSLVACIMPSSALMPTSTVLRSFVKEHLPECMLPTRFVVVPALPLQYDGAIDRQALLTQSIADLPHEPCNATPRNATEEIVAGIWAEVLELETVGIYDNFFELGGHSLLATQVIARVLDIFQDLHNQRDEIEGILLNQVFEDPTVAALANSLEQAHLAEHKFETLALLPTPRNQPLPLSFTQQRLWFLDQLEPGNPFYNIPVAVRIAGTLDVAALQQSLADVVARHEVLRTTFHVIDEQPVQVIAPTLMIDLPLVDLQHLAAAEREVAIQQISNAEAQQSFDLKTGPLLRGQVLRVGASEAVLLLTLHHSICDGWSMTVLVQELVRGYQAHCGQPIPPLAPLPIQYADYAAWQRQSLHGARRAQLLAYWTAQLAGAPPALALPTDHPRPALPRYRGATQRLTLSAPLTAALKALSQREGVTLFMTLLAAFQTLLWRHSGQTDLVLGTPLANRGRVELEGLIGFFANTLVLRTDLAGNPPFRTLLQRVRQTALGAYVHQDLPFEHLVDALQPQRDLSRNPLFQVMFILQNTPLAPMELPGLNFKMVTPEAGTAMFDLTLELQEFQGSLAGKFEYNTDLFEASTIAGLAAQYVLLLEQVVVAPERRLGALTLLPASQREQLLAAAQQTSMPYPAVGIHQRFEAQAAQTPQRVALHYRDEAITFAELNQRANLLAYQLIDRGVGPEQRVAICLERSVIAVVALLATLKAGAAYLPLDPSYPRERLQFMLADAHPALLLTTETLREHMLPPAELPVINLNAIAQPVPAAPLHNPPTAISPDHPAYIIYTSGSTGQPKGVVGLHRGVINRCAWMWQTYPFAPDEICCQKTALSFVDAVWEIWGPLLQGVPLLLLPDELVHDPAALVATIGQLPVQRLVLVPSLLRTLLASVPDLAGQLPHLRLWVVSGEELPPALWKQFQAQLPDRALLNLYGSSEVAADVSWHELAPLDTEAAHVPIGRPIANTKIYVLDEQLQPVPPGMVGEVFAGGAGLARGYLNQPELTADRFIPDSISGEPGARLYRTGDLARLLDDGRLEYRGRRDQQVKVRGQRIELGEIEAALAQHPAVRSAVVVARGRTQAPDDLRLIAYLVPQHAQADAQRAAITTDLSGYLKQRLPPAMVPAVFVLLEALPLTPSGKLDRNTLPIPELSSQAETVYLPPRNATEALLAELWAEVLGVARVGVHTSFFELGGHSLLAAQLIARVRKAFRVELPLRTLFQAPTLAELAEALVMLEPVPGQVAAIARLRTTINAMSADEIRQRLQAEITRR